jgi:hypothetical protein
VAARPIQPTEAADALSEVQARRDQVHTAMIGVRGGLAIATSALVLVGLNVGLSFGLQANDVPRSTMIAAVATAACIAVGGPLLMRYLRGVMSARSLGDR